MLSSHGPVQLTLPLSPHRLHYLAVRWRPSERDGVMQHRLSRTIGHLEGRV